MISQGVFLDEDAWYFFLSSIAYVALLFEASRGTYGLIQLKPRDPIIVIFAWWVGAIAVFIFCWFSVSAVALPRNVCFSVKNTVWLLIQFGSCVVILWLRYAASKEEWAINRRSNRRSQVPIERYSVIILESLGCPNGGVISIIISVGVLVGASTYWLVSRSYLPITVLVALSLEALLIITLVLKALCLDRQFRRLHYGICPRCHYHLVIAGSADVVCSECGLEYDVHDFRRIWESRLVSQFSVVRGRLDRSKNET